MSQDKKDLTRSVSGQKQEQDQEAAQRAAWRRPQLQRLRLSLDTASSPGSATDGGGRPSLGV